MSDNSQSNLKPSVCFVSLDNFAALMDDSTFGHIGGAEIQQALLGRELAKREYRVSFVTRDHGQDDEMKIEGMCIIKAYDQNVGIRVLRFLYPRLTSLWRAMRRADADIYYQRTSDSFTGIVAAFCRRYHRKFVFAVASDASCLISLPYCTARHERVFCRYGIRRANLIIAQTVTQKKLLHENFGVDSMVIPNCAPDNRHCSGGTEAAALSRRRHLLWVGGFNPVKRLELLLDAAEQLQDLQFVVIGDGNSESEYVRHLRSRAKSIPNVTLHGNVPHADVHQFYQQTTALICTSSAEGFPNTFLEAWSHCLPIVTTFDPDGIISSQGLGKVGKDVPELVAGIRELLNSPEQLQEISQKARQFYLKNYAIDIVMTKLEKVFIDSQRKSISIGSEMFQS
ncbi:MAG: glycosyltransferase family 4 protein [Planctomycetes bacterium]|nr:glycosyltransferase family 4 protein [Planctomycetota bacterium]